MSSARPTDPTGAAGHLLDHLVDDLATEAASVTELLPGGWREIEVPGVGRPVVMGPGGVFVLVVRHAATLAVGLPHDGAPDRPWTHDHRNQMSTPQITAELASQLLTWACGIPVACTPVVVVVGHETEPASRPDGVDVVHESAFTRWLSHLPHELDDETIGIVLEHVDVSGELLAI
ncbi:MAG: hypothetical protein U0Q03_09110 [Acidimicrobiales bacterium]